MIRPVWLTITCAIILFSLARASSAQNVRIPPTIAQGQGMGDTPVTTGGDEVQQKQALAANAQRQLEIRRDTQKMAELTQELNDYLQKSGPGVMSVDAIKKAEQIEKLAKSVKSKMKQSF